MNRVRKYALRASVAALATAFLMPGLASGGHEADVPASVAALGDSITTAWGSAGVAGDNKAASWATGSEVAVDSHVLRLDRRTIGGVTAANHAAPGRRMRAGASNVPAQAEGVAHGTDLVLVGAGSADLCLGGVTTAAAMTSEAVFGTSFRTLLNTLVSHTPDARVLVMSVPDWYGVWERHHGDVEMAVRWTAPGTCPLLFSATADPDTRAAVRDRTDAYNAILESVCAEFAGCRYDGGAAHAVVLEKADLSTYDGFHPSVSGQAKLAAATWAAGWHAMDEAPGGFTATPGDERVELSWSIPAGAVGVLIRQKTGSAPSGPGDGTEVYNGPDTSTIIAALTPGTSYHYAAFAYDIDGDTGPAATASATPTSALAAKPAAPSPPAIPPPASPSVLEATTQGGQHAGTFMPPRQPTVLGPNRVTGTQRADLMRGTRGRDVFFGLAGNDRLFGAGGDDLLFGGPGDDLLVGGPGNDVILGGPHRDRIHGGPGNDVILAADGWRDHIFCGPGLDRVIADRFDVVARDCEIVKRVGPGR